MGRWKIAAGFAVLTMGTALSMLPVQVADAQAPITAVLIPANNATVSGASQLLDASASSGATGVQFEITGGTLTNSVIAAATPTIYGWLAQWNTTSVPNGTYALQSVATYAGGVSTTSSPITISVNTPPPSTSVLIPANNATVSGTTQVLDASASPGVTHVLYEITGNTLTNAVIATATPTMYGWLAQWNTTSVANGSYMLQSVATYGGGVSTTSSPVTISVNTPPPNTTVLIPTSGADEDTATADVFDASASPGVTQVTFDLSGDCGSGIVFTATPTIYGWIFVTSPSSPGNHQPVDLNCYIQSVASYAGGVSGASSLVPITVIAYSISP